MHYKVTVEPADGTAAGWFVQYFRWVSPDAPEPQMHDLLAWTEKGGKFTAEVDLAPGEYGLVCHMILAGREVSVRLDPAPKVTQPRGQQWPLAVSVPATRTQITGTRYFLVP
ncbi:hypothetical protein [Sphingosinicella sp. BN140058]|uniref:hypothetical protein n=1 Tax=Sphingosinicella sp. BN140058 TaxID=1892855 RepID=UPI0010139F43|nr:hypothetical protein [Sphingosinicella sp. BN140058]QAY78435.1 hypothetical protein ETR14_19250 [Sphingosinicella sp. BN140058]